ncbi:heme exporter protein CcmD [Sporolactobacillus shoreicorticis]|uniref:Heme exporter protein CcmD n=1 Tax=Sporolactobacillus shoreicorticis TaxID=1923877 RepID=A0ABW5SC11_9BACL|nr:heme exporter protein CcmD [Sporolactobacillus shoreicorticis]MCO7126156.1 heme exporter protein CcmD [Sporolactobacillus shoreicorticis]
MEKKKKSTNWAAFLLRPYVWPFWIVAAAILAYAAANFCLTLIGRLPVTLRALTTQTHDGSLGQGGLPNLLSGFTPSWLITPHPSIWAAYGLAAIVLGVFILKILSRLRRAADQIERSARQ